MNRNAFTLAAASLLLAVSLSHAGATEKVSLPKGYEKWEKSKQKLEEYNSAASTH
jgi:hypothetical protein